MLTGPLPARLDHRKMASQAQVLRGAVPISQLPRFGEMLAEADGDIDLVLAFSRGKQGRTQIRGSAQAAVGLICQKCLRPFRQSLDCVINFEVVGSDAGCDQLEDDADTIVCDDKEISLTVLLEDELSMSMPMIPRHTVTQCPSNEYRRVDLELPIDEVKTTHRPFAGLAAAMKKKDNQES